MMTIVVIERDYSIRDEDLRDRYIGAPCRSFEEARELVYAHHHYGGDYNTSYVNNGTNYIEISGETGEILAEYFVRLIVEDS